MCKKCEDFADHVFAFEGSDAEHKAFEEWSVWNPRGSLEEFRDSDDWAQAFCDE